MTDTLQWSRQDVVCAMIHKQQPVQIPADLFKSQAWRPHVSDPPFEFEVAGIGIVYLNTPIQIHHDGYAVVLHSMGCNERLLPGKWQTLTFKHILFQDCEGKGIEKRMQMLRLCERQPARESGRKARILLERVGEIVVYDDFGR